MAIESAVREIGYVDRWWLSRDGLELYARDYEAAAGAARLPVVCLHGLTRNSSDFELLAPQLAAEVRRVIVPDVRGRGKSARSPDAGRYAVPTYARDLLALLDALGIGRAIFVGTSMGGLITMAIGGLRRRVIAAAVLNDVGPEIAQEGIDRITGYAGKAEAIQNWDEASAYMQKIMADAFPQGGRADWDLMARRSFRTKADGSLELDYDPEIRKPLSDQPIKRSTWIAWWLFRRLARRPVLLMRGELSDLVTAAIAAKMQRSAPSITVAEIAGVGHAPMLSEPDAEKALFEFLRPLP